MVAGAVQARMGNGSYRKDKLYAYGKAFTEAVSNIMQQESTDIFSEPIKTLRNTYSREALKEFFTKDFYDENNSMLTAEERDELNEDVAQIYDNDVKGINENAYSNEYSPMIGMALPIHKLILMNNVFSQGGGIQRVTAASPTFTISMERRILVTPQGEEIDMFLEQNRITDAINATVPTKEYILNLPQAEGATDILGDLGGIVGLDELSSSTALVGVFVPNVYYAVGDKLPVDGWFSPNEGEIATEAQTLDTWFRTHVEFTPYYGGPQRNDRILNRAITIKYKTGEDTVAVLKDTITGTLNKSKIAMNTMQGNIKKVMVAAKLNSSNAMRDVVSVKWDLNTEYVEIPEATPINTTVSPEEVKDISALYDANQVTKIMSITKTVLSEYKDKTIKNFLDDSFKQLDERTSFKGEFDFAVPEGYALDWVTYRYSTFMDYIDAIATRMLQVLNDPNMTFTIYGDPVIVRKITPKDYAYQAPANIGPVTLDYTQTIVNTSDNRVYNFVGSDKMRNTNELMLILNPRNTDRIIYRLYDYQLYISNEIRNASNPSLPAIHSFERFKMVQYQPVQARVSILNQLGDTRNPGF